VLPHTRRRWAFCARAFGGGLVAALCSVLAFFLFFFVKIQFGFVKILIGYPSVFLTILTIFRQISPEISL
jgi:hypothetical protein